MITGHERQQLQAAWLVYQHRVAVIRHQHTSATLQTELAAGRHSDSWQRQRTGAAPAAQSSSFGTAQVLLLLLPPLLLPLPLNSHSLPAFLLACRSSLR